MLSKLKEYLDLIGYAYNVLCRTKQVLYIPAIYFCCCCAVCCYTVVAAATASACDRCLSSYTGWQKNVAWLIASDFSAGFLKHDVYFKSANPLAVLLHLQPWFTWSRTRRRLSVSNGRLCAGACDKFPKTFAHRVGLFNAIVISSLVCWWVCLGVELCPTNATKTQSISTREASVEAPYLHLHPPLPVSKAVLSSWSLVEICSLITTVMFLSELELQAGTSSYHVLYISSIYGMHRYQVHLCYTCEYINADVPFVT